MQRIAVMEIVAVLIAAFLFNAFNAVYYYSLEMVDIGEIVLSVALLLGIFWSFKSLKSKQITSLPQTSKLLIGTALAELIVLTPDISFQYVNGLYISKSYAAAMLLAIIFVAVIAYFRSGKIQKTKHATVSHTSNYIPAMAVFFGFLGLYSLVFYSTNAFLNSQAFISTAIFMNEGILFAMVAFFEAFVR